MEMLLSSAHDSSFSRLNQMMEPEYPLTRDDVIWLLDFIKRKVADEDPVLQELPQPRLIQNFHYFAEIAMLLIHWRSGAALESDRLKLWMREASYGLYGAPRP